MKTFIISALVFGMTLAISGCTTSLQPQHVPVTRYDMMQVRSDTPVALVNVQELGLTMIKVGATDTETNLSLWSAQAIASIGVWLKLYNVPIDPEAEKKIKVSIIDPGINLRKHLPCAELTLKIVTESGLVRQYPVEGCAGTNNRAIGYAISYAVINMIHDRDITDYIDGKPAPKPPAKK